MTAGRTLNTLSQEWGTPKKYVKAVREFFGGHIHLDPCSNEYSIVHPKTEYQLPKQDGLRESWNFPTIYVNPPYGIDKERGTSIKKWLCRCATANKEHKSEILALVPVATNTGHWKNYVFGKATGVCFLYDTRLKFLVNGQDGGADGRVGDDFADDGVELLQRLAVEGVQDLGAVDGDNGDGVALFIEQVFVGHQITSRAKLLKPQMDTDTHR